LFVVLFVFKGKKNFGEFRFVCLFVRLFGVTTHANEEREREREREGEKSPFSSPLLSSFRTNERKRERKTEDEGEEQRQRRKEREREREREREEEETASARKTKKKRSLGGEGKKVREEILFFYHSRVTKTRERRSNGKERAKNVSHHDVRHGRILSGD